MGSRQPGVLGRGLGTNACAVSSRRQERAWEALGRLWLHGVEADWARPPAGAFRGRCRPTPSSGSAIGGSPWRISPRNRCPGSACARSTIRSWERSGALARRGAPIHGAAVAARNTRGSRTTRIHDAVSVSGTGVVELAWTAGASSGCPHRVGAHLAVPIVLVGGGGGRVAASRSAGGCGGSDGRSRIDGAGRWRARTNDPGSSTPRGLLATAGGADHRSLQTWPPPGAEAESGSKASTPGSGSEASVRARVRGLTRGLARRGGAEVWARVALPASVADGATYALHPVLLDTMAQALLLDAPSRGPMRLPLRRTRGAPCGRAGARRLFARLKLDGDATRSRLSCSTRPRSHSVGVEASPVTGDGRARGGSGRRIRLRRQERSLRRRAVALCGSGGGQERARFLAGLEAGPLADALGLAVSGA